MSGWFLNHAYRRALVMAICTSSATIHEDIFNCQANVEVDRGVGIVEQFLDRKGSSKREWSVTKFSFRTERDRLHLLLIWPKDAPLVQDHAGKVT